MIFSLEKFKYEQLSTIHIFKVDSHIEKSDRYGSLYAENYLHTGYFL